jgi:hypothetical protein
VGDIPADAAFTVVSVTATFKFNAFVPSFTFTWTAQTPGYVSACGSLRSYSNVKDKKFVAFFTFLLFLF